MQFLRPVLHLSPCWFRKNEVALTIDLRWLLAFLRPWNMEQQRQCAYSEREQGQRNYLSKWPGNTHCFCHLETRSWKVMLPMCPSPKMPTAQLQRIVMLTRRACPNFWFPATTGNWQFIQWMKTSGSSDREETSRLRVTLLKWGKKWDNGRGQEKS